MYGPADATVTLSSLDLLKYRMVPAYPVCLGDKKLNGCLSVQLLFSTRFTKALFYTNVGSGLYLDLLATHSVSAV